MVISTFFQPQIWDASYEWEAPAGERKLRFLATFLTALCVTGCASLPRDALPPAYADKAEGMQ